MAETEGEESGAGLGDEGVGFSEEDLTDLEDGGDTTGTVSPSSRDCLPPPDPPDLLTDASGSYICIIL